jgi:hypothetical protein
MMDQVNALFAKLETTFGLQAPQLKMAFKVTLTLVAFFVMWLILRQVLSFIEKRMKKINLIEIQGSLFKIMRKVLLLVLVLLTGTYLLELFNAVLLERIFHALFVILFATLDICNHGWPIKPIARSMISFSIFSFGFQTLLSIPWQSSLPSIFWGLMWSRSSPAPAWPGSPSVLPPKTRCRT